MPGRIREEDIEEVRVRTPIDEVIGEFVTLRPAGVGSLKGLCPFHDERSPSFNVRPQVGRYHCFGCGESGDVYTFLMSMDHITFVEAVERLAGKAGITLTYTDGAGPNREQTGRRQRLLDANAAAESWFREQLATAPAQVAREFLAERGFGREVAEQFSLGYAPPGWDNLVKHLRGRGYTDPELLAVGLVSEGRRGAIDRFRGRLIWPIRDLAGATVGFGARRLLDDDNGPKYLNTPETALYKKSSVLYGIDTAKREIAKTRRVVVVEGYTDVMAMHLSGITTAVATCGTAFGADHIKLVRRLIVDDETRGGEIVFTFDGDEAGRKAAVKAFAEDQRFVAQTFVAVEPNGLDPCDLRLQSGPAALAGLVERKEPLFEFVIRTTLAGLDLNLPEGRVQGLRAAAPVVAQIRDTSLRPEYARRLAGWLGMDVDEVRAAVQRAARSGAATRGGGQSRSAGDQRAARTAVQSGAAADGASPRPGPSWRLDPRDPVVAGERQLVQLLLQYPGTVNPDGYASLGASAFSAPALQAIDDAIRGLGGPAHAGGDWVDRVSQTAGEELASLVGQLAVASLPERREEHLPALADGLLRGVRQRQLNRQRAECYSRLQRAEAAGDAAGVQEASVELMRLQREEHALRSDRD